MLLVTPRKLRLIPGLPSFSPGLNITNVETMKKDEGAALRLLARATAAGRKGSPRSRASKRASLEESLPLITQQEPHSSSGRFTARTVTHQAAPWDEWRAERPPGSERHGKRGRDGVGGLEEVGREGGQQRTRRGDGAGLGRYKAEH
ncbi:unnamed protein product [Lampetra fluviatilis]